MTAPQSQQTGYPLIKRSLDGMPSTVDKATRSFEIVIATDAPNRIWIPDPRISDFENEDCSFIEVDEVLVIGGMDFSRTRGMPLLDNHDTFSGLRAQIGRVDNVRIDGQMVRGTGVLANKNADLITDIQEGFFSQVSAGYCHLETELVERADQVPLLLVHRWTLHEASLVPVGADPNAYVRNQQRTFPHPTTRVRALETTPQENKTMDLEELVTAAEDAETAAAAAAQAVVDAKDEGASEEVVERAKAIRAKRAEGDTPEKKDDTTAAAAADDDDAPDTEEEKKEVEEVRGYARELGLSQIVTDGLKMRSSAKAIRKAVRKAYFARSAAVEVPVVAAKRGADAPATLDTVQIYQRENSRFRGAKRA
ncbi:HK97 family phage prohead protease [Rhizobium sp. Z1P35]